MCFVWISEQTAIISLYNINWLVFITQPDSVYCALRTGSLYIIQAEYVIKLFQASFRHTSLYTKFPPILYTHKIIPVALRAISAVDWNS